MWLHVGDMLVLSEHMPLDAGLSVPRGCMPMHKLISSSADPCKAASCK